MPSAMRLVVWVVLFLGSTVVVSAAADGDDWQVRGAGGSLRTQREMRGKSKSGEGGSKSKESGGGTGKSKSNNDDHGADDTTAGIFPKYHTATQDPIPGQYVVTYKETDEIMADSEMDDMSEKLCSSKNGKLMSTYHQVLKGFSAKLTKEAAMEISEMDNIEAVEEDSVVRTNAVESWGLDRIDQRDLPLDDTYDPIIDGRPASNRGQGVTAYIIDTGIQSNHNEWGSGQGSRYAGGMNFVSDGRDSEDCDGHGTHVAGTVGGMTYGVANKVKLYAIRVLDCTGSGYFSDIISALEWIANNAAKPALANLSLGGGFSTSVNRAVNNLVDSGVVVTASAGNSNDDSCGQSPAAADKAITVGSTRQNDNRSSFSSYGPCVDIFAPGSSITSAWIGVAGATGTISGTSMSAPHVAGLAALYLGENPNLTPAEVTRKMLQYDATHGAVGGIPSPTVETANLLAYAGPNECAMKADGTTCTLPNKCVGTCQEKICSLSPGKFYVAIKGDRYPQEISWELRRGATVMVSKDDDTSSSGPLFCDQVDIVQGTSYTFEITDSSSNGLCCGDKDSLYGHGYYSIYDGNTHLQTGSNFGSSETTTFTAQTGGNTPPPSPMSTSPPTPIPTPIPTPMPTTMPTPMPTTMPTPMPTTMPTPMPPTPSPPACTDSHLRLKILKDGEIITRSCEWVARTDTSARCNLPGVSAACPETCESCDTCADPELRFKFTCNDFYIARSCEFVGRIPEKVSGRCAASQNICRLTCGTCSA